MLDLVAPDIKLRSGYTPYTDPAQALVMRHMPEPGQGLERKPYAVSLKDDCPYWTVILLGISFHKYTHTPVKRMGDSPKPTLPVFYFASNELEAIKIKAEDKMLVWKERTEKGIKVHSDPALKYIEIRPLPVNKEYENVVELSELMTLLLPSSEEESLDQKRKAFEKLKNEIREMEENAKKSEKEVRRKSEIK